MAPFRILVTGVSGYIGGTLLKHLLASAWASDLEVYALVRSAEQKEALQRHEGAQRVLVIMGDAMDAAAMKKAVSDHNIRIVVETVNSRSAVPSIPLIEALAEVQGRTGQQTHFFHTSGAKYFSSITGLDGTTVVSDTADVYTSQKVQTSTVPVMQKALSVNTTLIDLARSLHVKSYTIFPPMVYGPGEGFGNRISIQIVELFKIVRTFGKVFQLDPTETSWVLCHILDLTTLYLTVIEAIVQGKRPPCDEQGFYFAENGRFTWNELSQGIARALAIDQTVTPATKNDIDALARHLQCPPEYVAVACAGRCNIRGDNGRQLGWMPHYGRDHLLSDQGVGEDTRLMLKVVQGNEAARGSS